MSEEQTETRPQDTPSPEAVQETHERKSFETHIQSSGEPIPENFSSAGEWFDSLKEAQKQYTQGQQEIAALRQQYADNPPEAVGSTETAPETAEVSEEPLTSETPELRIQAPSEEPKVEEPAKTEGVSQEAYEAWGAEVAATGSITDDTRNEIRDATGFTNEMIDHYITGQKARARENFSKAAGVVGGREKLQQIFDWASKNLSSEDQQQINIGLASPSYEVTLRGLNSMYDSNVTLAKSQEPSSNPKLASMPASETGVMPYGNKREFVQERNDPKFKLEPRYRQQVEARMSKTDWNHLPQ